VERSFAVYVRPKVELNELALLIDLVLRTDPLLLPRFGLPPV
jgi:hypothetical protein